MEIMISLSKSGRAQTLLADESKLGFGKIFSDHMFSMRYNEGKGWHSPRISAYAKFEIEPSALCLHYAQLIFEGLKAYRGEDGTLYLFRHRENIRRFNTSAQRLCMPTIEEGLFEEALFKLVRCDREWVPHSLGSSLYIRPTMAATEPQLGVHSSNEYLFFIITSPVGAYYASGFAPTKIYVEEEFVRAAPGGTGFCKAAGNYAASLLASQKAMEKGFTQVLWLDALEKKFVEEVGTSNIFFLIDDELITPPLSGTILPGITRDTVIQLARFFGMKVVERRISIAEIIAANRAGRLKEAFASGTAAVVSPVGLIHYKGEDHIINGGELGEFTRKLYDEIVAIQYGRQEESFGWRVQVP